MLKIVIVVVLLLGLIGGIYLVQTQQIFRSRAAELPKGLTISPSGVKAGEKYTVAWSGIAPASTTDLVGLYKIGENDPTKSVSYFYTSSCSTYPGRAVMASGKCPLQVPQSLSVGNYQWRIFTKNDLTNQVAAASVNINPGPVTVPPTPTLVASSSLPANTPSCYSAIEDCDSGQGPGSGTNEGWGKIPTGGTCVITGRSSSCQPKPNRSRPVSENCSGGQCPYSILSAQCQLGSLILSWSTKGVDSVSSAVRVYDQTDKTQVNVDSASSGGGVVVKAVSNHRYDWWLHPVYPNGTLGEAKHGDIIQCPDLIPLNEGNNCTYYIGNDQGDETKLGLMKCHGKIIGGVCSTNTNGGGCSVTGQ